ncbi:MAG: acetyl-CoA carboxylase biotin carboxyl carrier protein [Alphaproteobacteria bacterium]|nr:acetyl-CoA carboxylase biotin carboxyl carrier protein [Alphaproteobacteria bacterium]
MPAKTSIDSDLIRTLASLLDETGLNEIEYDTGSLRIRVGRSAPPTVFAAHAAPAQPAAIAAAPIVEDVATHPGAVHSPMVGVVYMSPEPGSAPFVKIGDTVTEGQTIMLIEAMKTFNPIRATRGGKVARILVGDGHPVEFGEALMVIE